MKTLLDTRVEDIADVTTLIDEDMKLILIDDENKEIPSNLVAEFPRNACWLNLLAIGYLQLWCQPMGPLCLWQCFVDTTLISNIISLGRLFLTRAVSSMCQSFLGWTLVNSSKSTSMSWTWPTLGEEIMFRTDLLDDPSILDEYSMASASVYIQ